MIDHRHTELLFRPQEGVRITALTCEEERAETAQIVLAHGFAVRIFALDRAKRRRRSKQDLNAMLRDYPPERARIRSADRFALVEHRDIAVE